MCYFNEEAIQDFVQILLGLMEHFDEKSKNREIVYPWDNTRTLEYMREFEKRETKKSTNWISPKCKTSILK